MGGWYQWPKLHHRNTAPLTSLKVFRAYSLVKGELKVACCSLISFAVSIWLLQPRTILQLTKLNSMLRLTTNCYWKKRPKSTLRLCAHQYPTKSFGSHRPAPNANCCWNLPTRLLNRLQEESNIHFIYFKRVTKVAQHKKDCDNFQFKRKKLS